MQEFVDSLVAQGLLPGGVPLWAYYLGAMLVFGGIVVFVFILPIAGITTWVERRGARRLPRRLRPNRPAPPGLPQSRPGRIQHAREGEQRPHGGRRAARQ